MEKDNIVNRLKNTLIVSCQSSEDNPFCTAEHMVLLAKCSYIGGCKSFRVDTPEHIRAIKKAIPDALIIGIWKQDYPNCDVMITPTLVEVEALVACGIDVIAVDGTHSKNPNGVPAYTLIKDIKTRYPELVVMADIATSADAIASYKAGADIISTTLRGYTKDTKKYQQADCDIEFVREVRSLIPCFLCVEGKIWTKEEACLALRAGADAIVIGTAINNPKCITERFIKAMKEENYESYEDVSQ